MKKYREHWAKTENRTKTQTTTQIKTKTKTKTIKLSPRNLCRAGLVLKPTGY